MTALRPDAFAWAALGRCRHASSLAVAILAVLVAAAAPRAESLATAPGCTVERSGFARPQAPDSVPLLPVVIHYMLVDPKRPDGTADPDLAGHRQRVLDNRPRMEAMFAPPTHAPTRVDRNINDLWERAGIQFYLLRTELCEFRQSDVQGVPLPRPTWDALALFRELNGRFNTPGLAGLNIHLWPALDNLGGYGSPTRSSGPFPGAGGTWVNAVALEQQKQYPPDSSDPVDLPLDSVLLVAHEIGHFLGLRHRCAIDLEAVQSPDDPEIDLPRCPRSGSSKLLMSARADGTGLPRLDRDVARAAVLRLLGLQ